MIYPMTAFNNHFLKLIIKTNFVALKTIFVL